MELYVSDSCPACHALLQSPLLAGVAVRNITRDPAALANVHRLEIRSVPALVLPTGQIEGPEPIKAYLRSLGR
jgi:hypothetical protein